MTLALVFAMTGGAYAAKKYLISTTSQINPKVIAALKGKRGGNGAQGLQGPQGPQGAPGEKGTTGDKGSAGVAGKSVVSGVESKGANCAEGGSNFEVEGSGKKTFACNGEKGSAGSAGVAGKSVVSGVESKGANCAEGGSNFEVEGSGKKTFACNGATGAKGEPWTPDGTLPSKATEKGQWATFMSAAGAGKFTSAAISIPIPLSEPLDSEHVHIIGVGEKGKGPTEGCPTMSEVGKPEAEPGNLCIFEHVVNNLTFFVFRNQGGEEIKENEATAGTTGTTMIFSSGAEGVANAGGTWAVTAK
jgi:hypothetical protein